MFSNPVQILKGGGGQWLIKHSSYISDMEKLNRYIGRVTKRTLWSSSSSLLMHPPSLPLLSNSHWGMLCCFNKFLAVTVAMKQANLTLPRGIVSSSLNHGSEVFCQPWSKDDRPNWTGFLSNNDRIEMFGMRRKPKALPVFRTLHFRNT